METTKKITIFDWAALGRIGSDHEKCTMDNSAYTSLISSRQKTVLRDGCFGAF